MPLSFTDAELSLICPAPAHSPLTPMSLSVDSQSQRIFHLKAALSRKGFTQPVLEKRGASVFVRVQEQAVINSVKVIDAPLAIDISKKRDIVGQPSTPERIDDLKKWVEDLLHENGYGCAEVETNFVNGTIVVRVIPGPNLYFLNIQGDPTDQIDPNEYERFWAFERGEPFDERALLVTERRLENEGVVSGAHFDVRCDRDSSSVFARAVFGRPTVWHSRASLNTEQGVVSHLGVKRNRIDRKGSSFALELSADFRSQQIETETRWHLLSNGRRLFLHPIVELHRDQEQHFEVVGASSAVFVGTSIDENQRNITLEAGPQFALENVTVGAGPGASQSLFMSGDVKVEDRDHELHQKDPQRGYAVHIHGSLADKMLWSTATAQQITISGQELWNLGGYDPALLVLASRFGFGATLTGERVTPTTPLPNSFRYFLGGDSDLRGFYRKEIPKTGLGGITYAYLGTEVRLAHLFKSGFEPILFVDLGAVGAESFRLENPLYYSPGLGTRWASPLGVVRLTVAHGFVYAPTPQTGDSISHWQVYLAGGEEF